MPGSRPSRPDQASSAGAPVLDVGGDVRRWRAWLRAHHATAHGAWLVFWTKASGRPSLPYEAAVEEALCHGWIDSRRKRLDGQRLAQWFSPRRPGSPWSMPNRLRAAALVRSRRMHKAGLAALGLDAEAAKALAPTKPPRLAPDVARALRADPDAWRNYQHLPVAYRHIRIAYIEAGRRHGAEEVARRLRSFVRATAAGRRIGSATRKAAGVAKKEAAPKASAHRRGGKARTGPGTRRGTQAGERGQAVREAGAGRARAARKAS